ncbi:MAG: hypothetical protein AAGA29_08090 [Planctomycetota bacterium]
MAIGSILFILLALGLAAFIGVVLWFLIKTMAVPAAEQPDFTPDDERGSPRPRNIPACGKCGYPARGLNTLDCPECGADLREVGIMTPNMRRQGVSGCLLPVGFTVLVLVLALGARPAYFRHIPHRDVVQLNTGLYPNSHAYREIELVVTVALTYTPASQSGGGASTFSGGTYYTKSGSHRTAQRTLSWGILQPPAEIRAIRVKVRPVTNATAWIDGFIEVDPQTHSYEWSNPQGNTHQSASPLTHQEVLAFLKACGADANDPGVQRESQELFALIDGVSKGMSNFTLSEFAGPSSLSSHSTSSGPAAGWGLGYLGGWLALWITGLVWIGRRRKRKSGQ